MDFLMVAITAGVTLTGIAVAALFNYGVNLDTKRELKADISDVKTDLKADINSVRAEMVHLRTELKSDFRSEINSAKSELNAKVEASENRIKLEFAEVFYRNGNGSNGSKPTKKTERTTA